jgi:hypothetical protein
LALAEAALDEAIRAGALPEAEDSVARLALEEGIIA